MKNRRWNRSWAYPAASAIRKPHVVLCEERERFVHFQKHAVHCGLPLEIVAGALFFKRALVSKGKHFRTLRAEIRSLWNPLGREIDAK